MNSILISLIGNDAKIHFSLKIKNKPSHMKALLSVWSGPASGEVSLGFSVWGLTGL